MQIKKVLSNKNNIFEKRSSIRVYKKDHVITKEELSNIINDALSAPSSLNLQPWRFEVIYSKEAKEAVKEYMMFNKTQHETSSALIVVYADLEHAKRAKEILEADVKLGLRDSKSKDSMLSFIDNILTSRTKEQITNSHFLDCGFVTMQLMLSSVSYGYDTNPIGAFDKDGFSKYLNIDTSRYVPVILLSIGKADENIKETSRFSVDEVTSWH